MQKTQIYKAIKYIRLSYTDDKTVESDSVANQRRLIDDFIEKHPEIEVVGEKIDDGYSGVLFDRPAFQEMISDKSSPIVRSSFSPRSIHLKSSLRRSREYTSSLVNTLHLPFGFSLE